MSEGMSDIKRKTFVTQYQRTYRSSSSIDTHEFEKMRRRNINQSKYYFVEAISFLHAGVFL